MKKVIYRIWQWTWGLPQSILGLALYLRWRHCPHFEHHGALATQWGARGGISLGMFLFVPAPQNQSVRPDAPAPGTRARYEHTLFHEYGHTLQSLLLGPLYLVVIGIPSWLWCNLPPLRRLRKERGIPYDSFYVERWATAWGEWMARRAGDREKSS